MGEYKTAIADYDTAIRLAPYDMSAYFGRGLAKRALNKTSEAKQDFQTALRLATQADDVALKDDIESFLGRSEFKS